MKFGRRAFLQFAAGAVGGTLLSPLPWQLAADSARWSQNWSWVRHPNAARSPRVSTACTMCAGGCAIQARLVNGNRAIMVHGNPVNPLNQGGCLRPGRGRAAVFLCSLSHFQTHEAAEKPWRHFRLSTHFMGRSVGRTEQEAWQVAGRWQIRATRGNNFIQTEQHG